MSNAKMMDSLLDGFTKTGPAGLGCIVTKDGKRIYENYFGITDPESGKKVDENTVYRLFSCTKVIICTAALKLFEEGKYLLNEPVYKYFPEWKNAKKVVYNPNGNFSVVPLENPILIKHLFTMAMGIGYGGNDFTHQSAAKVRGELAKAHGGEGKYTLREDIKAMAEVPVAFEPGSHFLYGFGHEMVAGIIEAVSGMTVGEYLQKNIFNPINMKSTGYRYFDDIEKRMIPVCRREEDGSLTKLPHNDTRHMPTSVYEGGGAGLFSTVSDYSNFISVLANGGITKDGEQIIGRKTIDLMRDNQLSPAQLKDFYSTYNSGYGYGLGVRTFMGRAAGNSNGTPGEFGWTGVLGTYAIIDPEENFTITYMHQMSPNMEEEHHLRVRSVAYGMLK